jgi:hypothetical protein
MALLIFSWLPFRYAHGILERPAVAISDQRRSKMILISMIQNPPESAKEMVKRSMQMPRLP